MRTFFKSSHNAAVIPDKINNNSLVSSDTQCVVRFPLMVPKMSELVYRFKSQTNPHITFGFYETKTKTTLLWRNRTISSFYYFSPFLLCSF